MDMKQVSEQLRKNPKLMRQISQSADGKKLLNLLNGQGQDLQETVKKAQQGDVQAVTKLLKQVVADPDSRVLLERLSREIRK